LSLIKWLESWYLSQCNGEWEHSYGIKIDTLDNPGWSISISLLGTELEHKPFDALEQERSENDWLNCRLKDGSFEGFGGPTT